MKFYNNPEKETWPQLTKRPAINKNNLDQVVTDIINAVKRDKDKALQNFTLTFDQVKLTDLKVTTLEIEQAANQVSNELKQAIKTAANNIKKFHESQKQEEKQIETTPGVICWRKNTPIEKVGLYIPGGSAPLFSTLLMLAIPAQIAGCKQIILCTPANQSGNINPAILYTAHYLGIKTIYKVGGAQAIAAMAYGTETIPAVNKIFGPGNQFVTKAKELIQKDGIAIDLPAGPSEVLIIADENADPDFIAADLLSQAEHGPDSQVVLVTNSEKLINKTQAAINSQLKKLPRESVAEKALTNSLSVLLPTISDCIAFSNEYAPEHAIIAVNNAEQYIEQIQNAGSVFLGKYACESAGDYASGTNHTLPTNGYAKSYSGVSVDSFVKKITFQKISEKGILNLGPTIEVMAEAEQLWAHKNAVSIRLKKLKN